MAQKYKNTWIGLTLAAAIAFSTLLPFFSHYHDAAAPSSIQLASFLGDKILICTGEGFAWVKRADLVAGKGPVKQHKDYLCPLCYVAANGIGKILLPAAQMLLPARQSAETFSPAFLYNPALKAHAHAAAPPRAPPSFLS